MHPTQPSLGYDEVYYKLGRYTLGKDAINKKFDDWCEADGRSAAATVFRDTRLDDPSSFTCELPVGAETADSIAPMKTVVIGPGGEPFLTDGHHTLTCSIARRARRSRRVGIASCDGVAERRRVRVPGRGAP
ncbi:ParB/Srx family N-terminal domain-containing protein [Streptomyces sp. NPDC004227]